MGQDPSCGVARHAPGCLPPAPPGEHGKSADGFCEVKDGGRSAHRRRLRRRPHATPSTTCGAQRRPVTEAPAPAPHTDATAASCPSDSAEGGAPARPGRSSPSSHRFAIAPVTTRPAGQIAAAEQVSKRPEGRRGRRRAESDGAPPPGDVQRQASSARSVRPELRAPAAAAFNGPSRNRRVTGHRRWADPAATQPTFQEFLASTRMAAMFEPRRPTAYWASADGFASTSTKRAACGGNSSNGGFEGPCFGRPRHPGTGEPRTAAICGA